MDKIRINGTRPLYGTVAVSGAKNAALPLIAATLLTPGTHTLHNVPDLRDTRTMLKLLETLGATWERSGTSVQINTTDLTGTEAPYDLVKTMRASVLVLGPLITGLVMPGCPCLEAVPSVPGPLTFICVALNS